MKKHYISFEEYSAKNPDRNRKFDDFVRYAIKAQGYAEINSIKFKHTKNVEKFLKILEEAYQATKNSRLVFKTQKA